MDIILTGIARSGTTLTCFLLNKLPQTVALHEPINPVRLAGLSYPDEYLARLAGFFKQQRASLLMSGTAVSKARNGRVPDNPYSQTIDQAGLRLSTVENQEVQFGKHLHNGFRLVIKCPNLFTATLPALLTQYPCFALIRNPLAVLLSWHSIRAPVHDGHVPMGEMYDPVLREALAAEPDRVNRQLLILRWYFSIYASLLPCQNVLRYEDLAASGGRALAVIDPAAAMLREPLACRNTSDLYDAGLVRELSDRLLAEDSISAGFYPPTAIEALREEWLA